VGLKVEYPGLWVAGYVTVWYRSFWLKHWAGMGRVCWPESRGYRSNFDREVEKLRSNGIVESTQEIERQRPVQGVRRIVTVPFEFRSDHYCRIERDPRSLDRRIGEQGSFDEKEARVKVTTVGSHWRVRSTNKRHCGEPSCTGDNFPRLPQSKPRFHQGVTCQHQEKCRLLQTVDACPRKLKSMQ
jgi:hypothetical protein